MCKTKMTLAVDMDEVIADVPGKLRKLFNRDFGTPINLREIPGKELYDSIPSHARHKWDEYHHEKGFFRDLEVIPHSQEVLKALFDKYEIYIVSAAMEFRNSLEDKFDWLADHFPFMDWKHIVFCGDKIINTDILIDDRVKNFKHFVGRKLLYSAPHNLFIEAYERVDNWLEIAQKLL